MSDGASGGRAGDAAAHGAPGLAAVAARLAGQIGESQVVVDETARAITLFASATAEVVEGLRAAREGGLRVAIGGPASGAPAASGVAGAQALRGAMPGDVSRGALRLDLGRLSNVLALDETSRIVHAQAGIRLGALTERLEAYGLSPGPLPRASLGRTLGAMLAAPRPSEAGPTGRFIDRCAAVEAVLPDGTSLNTRLAPRKATGPDLLHVFLGARGATGVVTSAWLRVSRRPPQSAWLGFAFAGGAPDAWVRALAVARRLLDRGARPQVLELADADALPPGVPLRAALGHGDVLLVAHLAGVREQLAGEEALVMELAAAAGARPVAPALVEAWLRPRRDAPETTNADAERFVPMHALDEAWRARPRPARLVALHPAGAALCHDGARGAPPHASPADPVERFRAALRLRLDPARLLDSPPDTIDGRLDGPPRPLDGA